MINSKFVEAVEQRDIYKGRLSGEVTLFSLFFFTISFLFFFVKKKKEKAW